MNRFFRYFVIIGLFALFFVGNVLTPTILVNAEEQEENTTVSTPGASISITPTSSFFNFSANSVYDDVLSVKNDSSEPIKFEVYVAPYFYTYSEMNNSYTLGFGQENSYTQITNWLTIKNSNGDYVSGKPTFVVGPGETMDVSYRISAPDNVPNGGQYAVLFAHTLSDENSAGIRTEASAGMVIYGRSDGGLNISSEISDLKINQTIDKKTEIEENGKTKTKNVEKNHINASAKVKNNGNVDFNAYGKLKVEGIFGNVYYETSGVRGIVSIIPEAELTVSDEWEGTPAFGIFKVTWTVVAGDDTQTIESTVFLIPLPVIIINIILLTLVTMWIIISVKERKECRS